MDSCSFRETTTGKGRKKKIYFNNQKKKNCAPIVKEENNNKKTSAYIFAHVHPIANACRLIRKQNVHHQQQLTKQQQQDEWARRDLFSYISHRVIERCKNRGRNTKTAGRCKQHISFMHRSKQHFFVHFSLAQIQETKQKNVPFITMSQTLSARFLSYDS